MAAKTLKVKDLAGKYGLSPKDIVKELQDQGYESITGASSAIPQDEIELVEVIISEFQEKMKGGKKGKPGKNQNSSKSASPSEVTMAPPIIVKNLADALGKRPNEVVSGLMMMNVLASINQSVDPDVAVEFAKKCGITLHIGSKADAASAKADAEEIDPEDAAIAPGNPDDLKPRSPIVTFMGHVDHGKTSLQDRIRQTNVAGGEAGGITQNIGASVAQLNGKTITFVDTPGHEAFTQMRARGANVTDIVVLVVAADDGFMPQTVEALNHALAAKVPIIVAINKCDIPDADPDRVLLHMQQNGLTCEDWGGETAAIKVSAKTGEGIENLLERILLEAEMLELKADPKRAGFAYVLESQLEQGFGPTAHIIVKSGTIKLGDPILCGEHYGKVKNLIDVHGQRIKSAGPATPVKIAGLSGVPEAGSRMVVCENEGIAKELAAKRADAKRQEELSSKATGGTTLEELFSKMDEDAKKQLCVVLKGDVRGSVEAISESFTKLPNDKIAVNVVHSGVGAITENDVLLAKSSGGIVVGFHVRVNPGVNALAKKENVEIRLYSIIYELLEDIQDALAGRLEPEKREKILGDARILQIFELSKGPKICGCMVDKGSVKVGAKARVFRNNELIFNGEVRSLRRFHDDVKEVKQGLECGIKLDNFLDFEVGDHIQIYDVELKKATL
ncbi:MAG: translation initiation factor IF-2 [Lentisphaerae bacterium]|nr:translation initiation factor IF-2 [Lentisphaerota bacterium]